MIASAHHGITYLDAVAEGMRQAGSDPSVPLRDHSAIDLPVFTCSSRDYVRLKGVPITFQSGHTRLDSLTLGMQA
jgi:hypothetical protein